MRKIFSITLPALLLLGACAKDATPDTIFGYSRVMYDGACSIYDSKGNTEKAIDDLKQGYVGWGGKETDDNTVNFGLTNITVQEWNHRGEGAVLVCVMDD